MTQSTVARIDALYMAWIGYPIVSECGEHPLTALEILRDYRAAFRVT